MADISELLGYLKKLKKVIAGADFNIFGSTLVKRTKIDDVFCCIIATLPDVFKQATKKRLSMDLYPAVASYNRLSKIIKHSFFLSKDYYAFNGNEASILIQTIMKNIERDVSNLEQLEN